MSNLLYDKSIVGTNYLQWASFTNIGSRKDDLVIYLKKDDANESRNMVLCNCIFHTGCFIDTPKQFIDNLMNNEYQLKFFIEYVDTIFGYMKIRHEPVHKNAVEKANKLFIEMKKAALTHLLNFASYSRKSNENKLLKLTYILKYLELDNNEISSVINVFPGFIFKDNEVTFSKFLFELTNYWSDNHESKFLQLVINGNQILDILKTEYSYNKLIEFSDIDFIHYHSHKRFAIFAIDIKNSKDALVHIQNIFYEQLTNMSETNLEYFESIFENMSKFKETNKQFVCDMIITYTYRNNKKSNENIYYLLNRLIRNCIEYDYFKEFLYLVNGIRNGKNINFKVTSKNFYYDDDMFDFNNMVIDSYKNGDFPYHLYTKYHLLRHFPLKYFIKSFM